MDSVTSFLSDLPARLSLTKEQGYHTVDVLKHYIVWTHGGLFLDMDVRLESDAIGQLSPLFSASCRNSKYMALSHFMGLQGTTRYAIIFENQVLAFPAYLHTAAHRQKPSFSLFAASVPYLATEAALCIRAVSQEAKAASDMAMLNVSVRQWFSTGASAVRHIMRKRKRGKLSAEYFFDTAYRHICYAKRFRLRGLKAARSQFSE